MFDKRVEPEIKKLVTGIAIGIWAMLILGYALFETLEIELPGRILLFIPEQLGFFQKYNPHLNHVLEVDNEGVILQLRAGDYLMYPGWFVLDPAFRITEMVDGESVIITRGFNLPRIPYDDAPDFLKRGYYTFSIARDGEYLFSVSHGSGSLTIIPDIFRQNDRIVMWTLFVEFLIIVIIVSFDIRSVVKI